MPHYPFKGQTPDETVFGRGIAKLLRTHPHGGMTLGPKEFDSLAPAHTLCDSTRLIWRRRLFDDRWWDPITGKSTERSFGDRFGAVDR